jgi:hypothetical protein
MGVGLLALAYVCGQGRNGLPKGGLRHLIAGVVRNGFILVADCVFGPDKIRLAQGVSQCSNRGSGLNSPKSESRRLSAVAARR